MIFTSIGIWYFNSLMLTGIKIGNLPIEEVLFFITIPYACVFLYEALASVLKNEKLNVFGTVLFYGIFLFLFTATLLNLDKLYTTITFLLLIIYLIFIKVYIKAEYWNVAALSYVILLIPFFIVNGYLTGMFTEQAVVLYNNNENMGIRLITIPLEDTFYGLLLFLMNVSFFEYFKKNSQLKPKVLYG
jgi:lycopene cyclase domain-containing protein